MADKLTDDDYWRMSRELAERHASRMADSRGDSMAGSQPAQSNQVNDSRSEAQRSRVELSGGQNTNTGGKAGAEFKAGDRFANRFTIRALIAQGGMGAVYRAGDDNTGEVVALKTIRPDLVNSPAAVERFLAEGKVTRRLAHPGIARVFDIDKAEGRWFIAMEFVRGQNLREWMRSRDAKGARISVKDALWAARKILDVLAYLHAQGIIHRDLKPENIIVGKAADGSGNFLKIVDFGLARSLAGDGPQLTATGTVLGTFSYMSPEQRAGKALDQRSDLYSAAVIVYEMLTGVAYDGNWERMPGDVPVNIQQVLKGALSKFVEERPQSAFSFMQSLEIMHVAEAANARAVPHGGAVAAAGLTTAFPPNSNPAMEQRIRQEVEAAVNARLGDMSDKYAREALWCGIVNFVFGLFLCGIPSVICVIAGHRALKHARTGQHHAFALFALIVGYLYLAVICLGILSAFLQQSRH